MTHPAHETSELASPRRFSLRLPHPLWFFLATALLIVLGLGLRIGVPMYKQQVVAREIERLGGWCRSEPGGPDWLRSWLVKADPRLVSVHPKLAFWWNDAMTHSKHETGKPRRLSFRMPHPLWVLLAMVLLVSLFAGLRFGVPIYRQWAAIRHFRALGGEVYCDPNEGFVWLRERLSAKYLRFSAKYLELFDGPDLVTLDDLYVADADLRYLRALPTIKQLDLARTAVTDVGLANLEGLADLRRLTLNRAGVSDKGLVHILSLKKLGHLNLAGTDVTDAGIVELHQLPKLRLVYVTGTLVTKDGARRLKQLLPQVQIVGAGDPYYGKPNSYR